MIRILKGSISQTLGIYLKINKSYGEHSYWGSGSGSNGYGYAFNFGSGYSYGDYGLNSAGCEVLKD